MTPIYYADSPLDAHLVAQLLHSAGIDAHVLGADLLGAVGELPALGLVKVWVEDCNCERAKRLVADWHAAPVPDEDELASLADGLKPAFIRA